VAFISTSFGLPVPETGPAGVIPGTAGLVQLNIVPGVALAGEYVNNELLHIAGGVRVLVRTGFGNTMTVTFCVLTHPLAIKVYV
jgi:hypothetical protein